MLIEFRVKNFKSIRDEQVLSMVADKDMSHRDTHVISGLENCPDLLKVGVIYGANASGKSNLIEAIAFMYEKVLSQLAFLRGKGKENKLNTRLELARYQPTVPFKLSEEGQESQSKFELTFADRGVRYQYGFSMLREQVMEEWLLVYEKSRPQTWFERTYDFDKNEYRYETSKYLKGQKKMWQDATRPDTLFLATGSALNSRQLLRASAAFLASVFPITTIPDAHVPLTERSIKAIMDDVDKTLLLDFLKSADLGIEEIQFDKVMETPSLPEEVMDKEAESAYRIRFLHKGSVDDWFTLEEESSGTKQYFALASILFDLLSAGDVFVADELDCHMHPHMMRHIVRMFNSTENPAAQLIFTTHDVSLMDPTFVRRDQIWFTEKSEEGATSLFSLADFSVRKGENYMRSYLSGAYGALSFFSDFHVPSKKETELDGEE